MQKNELITRTLDPNDRRNVVVEATAKAEAIQKPIEAIIDKVNQQVLSPFSEEEKQFLRGALLTIARTKLK